MGPSQPYRNMSIYVTLLVGFFDYIRVSHCYRFCGVCRHCPVRAHWVAQSEFSELRVEKNMVRDHTPNRVFEMLVKLQKQEKLLKV